MFNRVILQGNIGRSPRLSLTQEGKEILTFSVATVSSWKACPPEGGELGEWVSITDWHHIAVFRESTIKWLKNKLKRGDPVYIEGKLTYNSWIDKYGQKRVNSHVTIAGRDGHIVHLPSAVIRSQSSNSNSNSNPVIQDTPNSACLEEEIYSEQEECSEDLSFEEEDIPLAEEKSSSLFH